MSLRAQPALSVIIPVLNEAARLPTLLASLAAQAPRPEIVVVDGGSRDESLAIAQRGADLALHGPIGRGAQLALGAARARGEVLLFLHADTIVPAGALDRLLGVLAASPDCPGGNFRLVFEADDGRGGSFSRWLTGFYAWLRRRGFYYGDSGIFVRRAVYQAIGGIRPLELMEDYDFIWRLEAAGATCCIAEPPLATSARRFTGRHPGALVAGGVWLHALFHLGLSPRHLARLYDSARRRRPH